jgi:hypothetical protein
MTQLFIVRLLNDEQSVENCAYRLKEDAELALSNTIENLPDGDLKERWSTDGIVDTVDENDWLKPIN